MRRSSAAPGVPGRPSGSGSGSGSGLGPGTPRGPRRSLSDTVSSLGGPPPLPSSSLSSSMLSRHRASASVGGSVSASSRASSVSAAGVGLGAGAASVPRKSSRADDDVHVEPDKDEDASMDVDVGPGAVGASVDGDEDADGDADAYMDVDEEALPSGMAAFGVPPGVHAAVSLGRARAAMSVDATGAGSGSGLGAGAGAHPAPSADADADADPDMDLDEYLAQLPEEQRLDKIRALTEARQASEKSLCMFQGALKLVEEQEAWGESMGGCAVCRRALPAGSERAACSARLRERHAALERARDGAELLAIHQECVRQIAVLDAGRGRSRSFRVSEARVLVNIRAGALVELRNQKHEVLAAGHCFACLHPVRGADVERYLAATDKRAAEMERLLGPAPARLS